MGQVGCDFSSLVMPLFCKAISDRVSDSWDSTIGHFKVMLATERFVLENDDFSREQVIPLYLRQEMNEADDQVYTALSMIYCMFSRVY